MKRRIEQLLNGIFEYKAPTMNISVDEIRVLVKKGESYRGSFEIGNPEEKKMKGFIYSSSARVAYEPSDFFGNNEKIVYEIDTTGMEEGEVLEGAFTICSNLGEYRIPFRLEIEYSKEQELAVAYKSLDEFTALAKEDFQKAYVLFISSEFYHMLPKWTPSFASLYEGIRGQNFSYRSLEEFLVGCGKKKPVKLHMSELSRSFPVMTQSTKEVLTLTKDSWGFLRLDIQADTDFITIDHETVTTDEFVGSTYSLEYVIDLEKLHGGKNFGRITLSSGYETLVFEIEAFKAVKGSGERKGYKQHRAVARMMSAYMDFRLKRKKLGEWLDVSERALGDYRNAGGNHVFFELYQVQLLFARERMVDACMALEEIENHKDRIDRPELEGYYLYLTTFYNRDTKYIDYIEEKVYELYLQNKENWMLQWILLYLQEPSVCGPLDRMSAVRDQYICGCTSPVMYVEGVQILQKEPLILKRLDDFEIQLLRFVCKEEVMNREIAEQAAELTLRHREFNEGLFAVLTYCYEKYPVKSIITAVCSLLIKGHKTEKKYFKWYAKGVEYELRLTGLYEYYIETMEDDTDRILPQMVRMYFAYNNTLSYNKKAFVYANVIRNHSKDPETYKSYRPAMERFMVDQLALGRISRDLALIYDTFLTKAIMNKRMADGLARAIFTYELKCDIARMKSVIVIHSQLKNEIRSVIQDGKAYVQLYTGDYRILFEDEEGNRYASEIPYTLTKLMDRPAFREYCRELCPDNAGLVLNSCYLDSKEILITAENADSYGRLLEIEEIRETYKEQLRCKILEYYYENPAAEQRYEYLHRIDYHEFVKTDKKKLIELLTEEGMCQEAFGLVSIYGPENIDLIQLVRLCSRTILEKEYGTDDMLLFLCAYCFASQKYDETILAYLLMYYDGPIEIMKNIWKAGREFGLDGFEMEEKILIFVLFMRVGSEDTEEIFDSYRKKMGKKQICLAYVILSAYNYFVKEKQVAQPVFDYIERLAVKQQVPERICELALLRNYAEKPDLTDGQETVINRMMEDISYEGLRFAFFEELPDAFTRPYQLSDKTYVEYRANPKSRVVIHYRLGGEENGFKTEPMKNMYEGIFVKEFTLFYGDELTWHLVEELDNQTITTEDQTIYYTKKSKPEGNSQYDLINHMMEAIQTGNKQAVEDNKQTYIEQNYFIGRLFGGYTN